MNYPPPYQDIDTLCQHICVSPTTVDLWVKSGKLPPPKVRDGKRLWKWKEVEARLDGTDDRIPLSPDAQAEEITNATRKAIQSA
jgi:hypothetical protein